MPAISAGGQEAVTGALDLITTFRQQQAGPEAGRGLRTGFAQVQVRLGEDRSRQPRSTNEPGHFTTLIGFEWTSLVNGRNMHRNVIFRDGAGQGGPGCALHDDAAVRQHRSPRPLRSGWMSYEKKTGGSVLAIAHNGNLSNGIMFPVDASSTRAARSTRSTSRHAPSGSRSTRSPRSRVTARRIPFCLPTTSLPITRPGTRATSTSW